MKKALIIVISIILTGAAVFVWQLQDKRAKAARVESETLKGLTAAELALVLESEAPADPQFISVLSESPERRQLFLKGMREHLALAAQARREEMTESEDYRTNVRYKKDILLADLYRLKLSEPKKLYIVPEEEVKEVWQNAENEKLFLKDFETMQKIQREAAEASGRQIPTTRLEGKVLNEAKKKWATTKILAARAAADAEFMRRPDVELRLKIVEAGILSNEYLRANWAARVRATDEEIKNHLAAHPEYDVEKKREKAGQLLRKVQAGEDFAGLAKAFSEDRSTAAGGGLYEDVGPNALWKEVEEAALKLKKGETADRLIESHTGFHIVRLENKKVARKADGTEEIKLSVRHILLQKNFEEPGAHHPDLPPPFMPAEEIARSEVEKAKRAAFVGEIIDLNPVFLPEDFTVEAPASLNGGNSE